MSPLPLLRLLLGVQFSLDFPMRDGNQTPHKTREFTKIAFNILRRNDGASWLLRHVDPSEMRVFLRASKVKNGILKMPPSEIPGQLERMADAP